MTRPRILVTCWRRPLPTYLGERTILDTLDPAYAGRVPTPAACRWWCPALPVDALDDAAGPRRRAAPHRRRRRRPGVVRRGARERRRARRRRRRLGARADRSRARARAADARDLPGRAAARGRPRRSARPAAPGRDGHDDLAASRPRRSCRRATRRARPGSRVERRSGAIAVAVNTIHHHGIADPGELEVTATAPGGVIEAVEPRSELAVRRCPVASREDARARAGRVVRAAGGRRRASAPRWRRDASAATPRRSRPTGAPGSSRRRRGTTRVTS